MQLFQLNINQKMVIKFIVLELDDRTLSNVCVRVLYDY